MSYIITLDGLHFCYYGQGFYGWGRRSSLYLNLSGEPVQFTMRSEADDYMSQRRVFFAGAKVERARETVSQPLQDVHAV